MKFLLDTHALLVTVQGVSDATGDRYALITWYRERATKIVSKQSRQF
jgi:hypothetical protein